VFRMFVRPSVRLSVCQSICLSAAQLKNGWPVVAENLHAGTI